MIPDKAITIGQILLTGASAVLLWSLRKAFWAGGVSTDIESRIKRLETRMDQAGREMSEFATDLQGALERYRKVFATLEQHSDLKERLGTIERRETNGNDSPWPNNRRRKPS